MPKTSPTFLIPGASRGGTSSLYYYLREHPDIFFPSTKELRFFDRTANFEKGLGYYERMFDEWNGESAVGEISPPYWYRGITFDSEGQYRWNPDDDVPTRVSEAYPDVKLIFTLRNPITRSYSQYWKNVRQGRERAPTFRAAIERELEGDRSKESSGLCWLYKNRYSVHLSSGSNCSTRIGFSS